MKRRFDYTFRALGSLFVVTFFREDDGGLDALVQRVFKTVSDFEKEFSRFVPDSSLSVLNRLGRSSVSHDFRELLEISKDCYFRSEGYFNPLFNVAVLGYSNDFETANFVREALDEPLRTDFENVEILGNEVVLQRGMKLDFWAVGKGYLSEKVALSLRSEGHSDAILNFGGDIFVLGGGSSGNGHSVGIMSPFEEGGVFGTVQVSDASVSSSGSYLRKWKIGNDEYRHIVFPTAIAAGDECSSVTVVDASGAVSDAFATALFSAGVSKGMEIAVSAGVDALFVKTDRSILHTPGFAEKWKLKTSLA